MLGLPQSTEVKRPMPKAKLYKKFELKQAQCDAFDKDIARVDIVNYVAQRTIPAIAEGNEVKAIFVVEVELEHADYNPKSIILISKLIPQRMVFALRFEDIVQIGVYHTKLFTSAWQSLDTTKLTLSGLNLDAVWQNIVAPIGAVKVADGNTLADQIKTDEDRAKILRQLETLERQMRSTSQTCRQRGEGKDGECQETFQFHLYQQDPL